MYLNDLKPQDGARKKKKRVGRGIGSGLGKTCGRGHKGTKARSGGSVSPGFEGGQQPLYRRLPKFGFKSRVGMVTEEVRMGDLDKLGIEVIGLDELKSAGLVSRTTKFVKVINSGELTKKVELKGVRATASVVKAIEALGGKVD